LGNDGQVVSVNFGREVSKADGQVSVGVRFSKKEWKIGQLRTPGVAYGQILTHTDT